MDPYEILTDNHNIDSTNSLTLLGIKIDNKLNFEKHVTALYQKAGHQLNALSRIHRYIEFQEMKMLLDNVNWKCYLKMSSCVAFPRCRFVTENRKNTGTCIEVII